uniref:Uncharacterized protein n=1 Tax=Arundo donax TaxID=35708 RepID=A0A0A8ZQH7_ARUDO
MHPTYKILSTRRTSYILRFIKSDLHLLSNILSFW